MVPIAYLRHFRIFNYAIFDLAAAFLGIYLLSPYLSKLFRKIKIEIPEKNWIFLTLPIGILSHLAFGRMTPMTRDFFSTNDHFVLKGVILGSLFLGLRNIKTIKSSAKYKGAKKK